MSKHLRIILPLSKKDFVLEYCQEFYSNSIDGVEISISFLLNSQESIVSVYDDIQIAPEILKAVQAAELDGCDGVFISVAFDTALSAAKSMVNFPVVGALESTISIAKSISKKFSIIAINEEEILINTIISRKYGFANELISIEKINIPVLDLSMDKNRTLAKMVKASEKAMLSGAEAIILGCTGMGWLRKDLENSLGIPVLDTSIIGLYQLYMMCQLGISQSKKTYIPPSNLIPLTEEDHISLKNITFKIQ